ncbi:MAG: hypothetical protein ACLFRG_08550 [Desulfococcaceae bacterium]
MSDHVFRLVYPNAPAARALLATLSTWFLVAAGAAPVLFFREINRKLLDGMSGFAVGVMIAAAHWSLLAPAIALAEGGSVPPMDSGRDCFF